MKKNLKLKLDFTHKKNRYQLGYISILMQVQKFQVKNRTGENGYVDTPFNLHKRVSCSQGEYNYVVLMVLL